MQVCISVIICTHNPRSNYLQPVLHALKEQVLPKDNWELLVVDNASENVLEEIWDLRWHPYARHLREERLGLTQARICGIRESRGEIIVFVDDDNLLAKDYLQNALIIGRSWPQLGVWGGRIDGCFEKPPPAWAAKHLAMLAIRDVKKDLWSNSPQATDAMPCGAGMVLRRKICTEYCAKSDASPIHAMLGRKGEHLASCEDSDLVYTALDSGYGFGVFESLSLTHLIHESRLTENYFTRLIEGMTFSRTLLDSLRQAEPNVAPPHNGFVARLSQLLTSRQDRRFFLARRRGLRKALRLLAGQATRKAPAGSVTH